MTYIYYSNIIRSNGQLKILFWADSICRLDYSCFGNVVACSLLQDETASSYMWLLKTFLDCMVNKKPTTIVIDEDHCNTL